MKMRKSIFSKNKVLPIVFIIGILMISVLFVYSTNPISNDINIVDNNKLGTEDIKQISVADETVSDSSYTRGSTREHPDVGIISAEDIDAVKFIDHYPGKVVHFNVTLRNFGNDLYTEFDIILTISDGTTQPPSYHYFDNKTVPDCLNREFLKGNTSYNISWNWTPPLSMPHGCQKNFSVGDVTFKACFTTLLEVDKNSNNNQNCIPVKIQQPDFNIELKEGHYSEKGQLYPGTKSDDPLDFYFTPKTGQTNQFDLNFTLFNYGEATYINYTLVSPPDWKVIPPARQFWQARSNSSAPPMNLTITVFPSVKLQFLPTATPLLISLTAIAESYPLARTTIVFRGQVDFVPNPDITPPVIPEGFEVYYIAPGWNYIEFKVTNMGNGEDNYETWAMVGEPNIPSNYLLLGWKAVVHSGKYTRILKRGESQMVSIKVYVPTTVRAGSPCPITLFARSVKNPFHMDSENNNTFYIFADLFRDVSFDDKNPKTIPMYPNQDVSRIIRIRNTGNKLDNSIRVNVTNSPENWEVILDSSDIPPGGLPRNGTAEIEVIIKTPKDVVESLYYIHLAAISESQIGDEIALPVQIQKVRNIALTCKNFKKIGNVSEKISYLVTVENRGNSKDSVDLRFNYVIPAMKNMDWKVVMSKNFTTLYPYETRDVIVSVFIPLEALADTNFLTPTLDGYPILVRGISQNDTSVTAEKEIVVLVNPIYDFSFNKQSDRKYLILRHTQSVYYSFALYNEGNDKDKYTLSAESDHDWITIPFTERNLQPGVLEKLFLELNPPEVLDPGVYEFVIKAVSQKDPKLVRTLNLTIEIIEFDLTLSEIRIGEDTLQNADIQEGETVLLRVKLENIGDLDYYNKTLESLVGGDKDLSLIIQFTEGQNYIGETNLSYLPSKASGLNNTIWVGLPWKIGKARTYEISIVVDPDEKIPESKTTNNKISGNLIVESPFAEENEDQVEGSNFNLVLILIVIFIIIMLIGIWMTINLSKKQVKRGYTETGEYKPYEERTKAQFDKDEDEEEEPEGGVLAIQDESPYGGKKKDKFVSDLAAMTTMKPIRKTKPIRRSKPLTSLVGEGKYHGLDRPKIAGYLPPKPKDDASKGSSSGISTDSGTGI